MGKAIRQRELQSSQRSRRRTGFPIRTVESDARRPVPPPYSAAEFGRKLFGDTPIRHDPARDAIVTSLERRASDPPVPVPDWTRARDLHVSHRDREGSQGLPDGAGQILRQTEVGAGNHQRLKQLAKVQLTLLAVLREVAQAFT